MDEEDRQGTVHSREKKRGGCLTRGVALDETTVKPTFAVIYRIARPRSVRVVNCDIEGFREDYSCAGSKKEGQGQEVNHT